jgi:hypothetical protein
MSGSEVLQWGRDQVIAECPRNVGLIMGFYVLQWGPDPVIAEWRT